MSQEDGEILDPEKPGKDPFSGSGNLAITNALIQQFQNRPDLTLQAIEEKNPGFIKEASDEFLRHSKRINRANYLFRSVSLLSSLGFRNLVILWVIIEVAMVGFTEISASRLLIALGFILVVHSGSQGITTIVKSIADLIRQWGNSTQK